MTYHDVVSRDAQIVNANKIISDVPILIILDDYDEDDSDDDDDKEVVVELEEEREEQIHSNRKKKVSLIPRQVDRDQRIDKEKRR